MPQRKPQARNQPRDPAQTLSLEGRFPLPPMTASARQFLCEKIGEFWDDLVEQAAKLAGDAVVEESHFQQAYAILRSRTPDANWPVTNRRRVYLIRKKIDRSISSSELEELQTLQAAADRYMEEVAPRPLEELWRLEEELRRRTSDVEEHH